MSFVNNINSYLKNIENQYEKPEKILKLICDKTESADATVFLYHKNKYNYFCTTIDNCKFNSKEKIKDVLYNNQGYSCSYEVKTIMIIPISFDNNYNGILCIINKESPYDFKDLDKINIFISILRLLINNKNTIEYYNKLLNSESLIPKDMFLANMSHEIRTPLNGVIGYNQLLMQTPLTNIQKNYLISMNQCSIQLMQIINDILDYSKLTSGKMSVTIECFSIEEIIQNVKNAINKMLNEKKQIINFNIYDCPEFILSDRNKIIQILINLITNASKFSDIGKPIEVNIKGNTENTIKFSIIDKGIGISDKDKYKLFNAFIQLEESTKKTGTGLGLAISKKLINLLGGEITVNSQLGIGSEFIFTIEFKPYKDYEKNMTKDMKLLHGKNVLVVDDIANNRILLHDILFEWKMNPIICASALEAIRLVMCKRYKFDIGLIDICMPNISGSELAKQIKEEKPLLPLVALSSIDSFINTVDFECKLDKPINKVQLFHTMHRIITKYSIPSSYIGDSPFNKNSPSDSPTNSKKGLKILIAEDISYNSNLLINMLQNIGFSDIDTAENGKITLEKIIKAHDNNEPYNILLLDLRMPEMDGHEVVCKLRENNINYLQIIVITASVIEKDVLKCKQKGIEYFITKPIDFGQFKQIMTHATEKL